MFVKYLTSILKQHNEPYLQTKQTSNYVIWEIIVDVFIKEKESLHGKKIEPTNLFSYEVFRIIY